MSQSNSVLFPPNTFQYIHPEWEISDGNLVWFHIGMGRDQLIGIILGIQVQQMILFAEHLTGLIQFTHADAHIVCLRNQRRIDQFSGVNVIWLTLQSAERNAIITAAEEDNPPIGSVPSITPQIPNRRGYFLPNAQVALRR